MTWKITAHTETRGQLDSIEVNTLKEAKKQIKSIFKRGLFIFKGESHYSYYPLRVINLIEANEIKQQNT